MYELEHNIPISGYGYKKVKGATKYPFAEMANGDSFFVDPKGETVRKVQNRTSNAARSWIKYNKIQDVIFVTRTVTDATYGRGVRVWMISKGE